MDVPLQQKIGIARHLAVTVAFTVGALGFAGSLVGLSMLGFDVGVVGENDRLFQQSYFLVSRAVLAGLIVDSLRFLSDRYWRKKPRFRLKLNKVLKQNLA